MPFAILLAKGDVARSAPCTTEQTRYQQDMRIALPLPHPGQRAKQEGALARRQKRRPIFRILVFLCVLAVAGAGFFFWRAQQDTSAATPSISVPVMRGNLDINVESSGKVQPSKNVPVVAEAAGHVTQVLVS